LALSFDTSTIFKHQTTIANHQGERFKNHTCLTLLNDDAIKLEATDYGPSVEEWFGSDRDYEYWVDVPPAAVGKLAYELLAEKYRGDRDAVDKFRAWCQEHDVKHEWEVW
jgi:hypothetical protein